MSAKSAFDPNSPDPSIKVREPSRPLREEMEDADDLSDVLTNMYFTPSGTFGIRIPDSQIVHAKYGLQH